MISKIGSCAFWGSIFSIMVLLNACSQGENHQSESGIPSRTLAKFEPEGDQCILFVGQDLASIGGLEEYNDGYFDHFKNPAGFTMYTTMTPGNPSFGYTYRGLDGIWTTDDWGDSPSNMSLQIEDADFAHAALAIGLSLVHHEDKVASGEHDSLIVKMANWFKSLGKRPVFLRIGYEFDGHVWNFYEKEAYIAAFRRIKDMNDSMGVNNVCYVWQSAGFPTSSQELLEEWYPGDEYVDWCSFSFFARWREVEMVEFARRHKKPVFIAEATPTIGDHMLKFDGDTKKTDLANPTDAQEAWDQWFVPLFDMIEANKDIIKGLSYINCNWKERPMWKENKTFQEIDARLQLSPELSEKWKSKVYSKAFLNSSDSLYKLLWRE